MEGNAQSTVSHSRPYRSHKVPACNLCRKRKIRCEIDAARDSCRMCLERDMKCEFSRTMHQAKDRKHSRPQTSNSRQHHKRITHHGTSGAEHHTSPEECQTLIANPTMAEDLDVLETYITSHSTTDTLSMRPYIRSARKRNESVMYLPVPQRRPKPLSKTTPGREQRNIMDEVLGPQKEEVIKLYFAHVHPCLPIIDRDTFLELWDRDRDRISPTLICDIYATTVPYRASSESLNWRHRPDSVFAWNQAIAALEEDFTAAPSMTTLHSVLIDIGGRPAVEMRHNLLNVGRACQLAHTFGLHRNPLSWQIPNAEKTLRINLWWAILIHDYWSSLTHGSPPVLQQNYFDVTLPSSEILRGSSPTFVELCTLTKILGDLLPLIYALRPKPLDMWNKIRGVERSMDEIELKLSPLLTEQARSAGVNGESNLLLCLYALRLVLNRVMFGAIGTEELNTAQLKEIKASRLAALRHSALKLTTFVTSLENKHFQEFWLPYASHILVLATTVLLRCIAESGDEEAKQHCVQNLVSFMDRLKSARSDCEWELADTCLERYGPIVQSIAENMGGFTGRASAVLSEQITRGDTNCNNTYMDGSPSILTPIQGMSLRMDWLNEYSWLDDLFPLAE